MIPFPGCCAALNAALLIRGPSLGTRDSAMPYALYNVDIAPAGSSFLPNGAGRTARCFTEKLLTYSLGRGLEYYDKCAVDSLTAAMAKDNYRITTLIQEIVQSEPFQKRRGKKD